jgi:hypothetical protein
MELETKIMNNLVKAGIWAKKKEWQPP